MKQLNCITIQSSVLAARTHAELIELFLKIAASEMTRDEVEQFFAKNVKLKE